LPRAVTWDKMGHGDDIAADGRIRRTDSMPAEIVAHRGVNREAPENTLPAFQRALDVGVQGIELDVQITRDGVPIIHHDPDLRVTGQVTDWLLISVLALSEFRKLSAAPTLEEVLDLVDGRCRVYVEIKAVAAVESVVEQLKGRHSWCALHSFDHRAVAKARSLDADLATGILLVSYLVDTVSAMRAANARDVWQKTEFIDRALVDGVHDAGGRVIAWTVNDVGRARRLSELGVDAICTDMPRELLVELGRTPE